MINLQSIASKVSEMIETQKSTLESALNSDNLALASVGNSPTGETKIIWF